MSAFLRGACALLIAAGVAGGVNAASDSKAAVVAASDSVASTTAFAKQGASGRRFVKAMQGGLAVEQPTAHRIQQASAFWPSVGGALVYSRWTTAALVACLAAMASAIAVVRSASRSQYPAVTTVSLFRKDRAEARAARRAARRGNWPTVKVTW